MAFRDIADQIQYPDEVSERYKKLDALERLLDGSFYEHLPYAWDQEYDTAGQYVLQKKRRPAVIYNLPNILSSLTSSLTFGKGHAPRLKCVNPHGQEKKYEATQDALSQVTDGSYSRIWQKMMMAARRGSIGSCALVVRALPSKKPWISVVSGKQARPIYSPSDPSTLLGLIQQTVVTREDLTQMGYGDDEFDEDEEQFWLRVTLDRSQEVWYKPRPTNKYSKLKKIGFSVDWTDETKKNPWVVDKIRSGRHGFDITPAVWCRNLEETELIDGPCTFGAIKDICVDIDYKFSQISRGITLAADPLLIVKRGELNALVNTELGGGGRQIVKDGSAIELGKDEDAKLLEMNGGGLEGAREYIKMIREYALEVAGGMKSDSEHSGGMQSGVAMDRLFAAVEQLIDRQQVAYGDDAAIPLARIMLQGVKTGVLALPDGNAEVDVWAPIQSDWPQKRVPRGAELAQTVQALQGLGGGSVKDPIQILPDDMVTAIAAASTGSADVEAVVEAMREERERKAEEALQQQQDDLKFAVALKQETQQPSNSNS